MKIKKCLVDRRTNFIIHRFKINAAIGLCFICGPKSGCNFWNESHPQRSWKKHRKTQWKNKRHY